MHRPSGASAPQGDGPTDARSAPDRPLAADVKARMLERIRGEYHEMPGLTLTVKQAERLWSLDGQVCQEFLTVLVDDGFLCRKPNGAYRRAGESDQAVRPRMAKAGLEPKTSSPARRVKGDR